jgi:hypothetical protein
VATITHYGPYEFDFGPRGLAPGDAIRVSWRGRPQPANFTVVVTAHPDTSEARHETHQVTNTLYVLDHSVQYVPHIDGKIVTRELIIYATLRNGGGSAIRWASVFITFIQP